MNENVTVEWSQRSMDGDSLILCASVRGARGELAQSKESDSYGVFFAGVGGFGHKVADIDGLDCAKAFLSGFLLGALNSAIVKKGGDA